MCMHNAYMCFSACGLRKSTVSRIGGAAGSTRCWSSARPFLTSPLSRTLSSTAWSWRRMCPQPLSRLFSLSLCCPTYYLLCLCSDGKKMSKRLKNYPDPAHVLQAYGADALRLYLINSPVVRAEPLRFKEEGVKGMHLARASVVALQLCSWFAVQCRCDQGCLPALV